MHTIVMRKIMNLEMLGDAYAAFIVVLFINFFCYFLTK